MNIYYIDGQFVEDHQAKIPVEDLSVLRGYGVFDFLRTYNGVPFHLDDHLLRLQRSARLIGLQLTHTPAALTEIVRETLARNTHLESNIRIVVTGGMSQDGITPGDSPRLMVMIGPVKPMPEEWYTDGAKVITCHVDRFMPGAKSINYIPAILCQAEARSHQAIEAVYVDRDGYLLEGTTSNLVALRGDTLITPPCNRILPGITRQVVLQLARQEFEVEERQLHKDEIRLLDEAFLTSSVKEVAPVVTIDSMSIGGGEPGSRTLRVMELFREYTAAYRD
ncbi:MAG: aminotransferase class IV [Proteobacteria bacterium]|nr:aminotransferase class IV [Pseudomonadota bacterium]